MKEVLLSWTFWQVKKAVVPNLEDVTDRLTYGDMDTGEDLAFTDDAGDALFEDPSSDNVQVSQVFVLQK